jgi:hypothetical protein
MGGLPEGSMGVPPMFAVLRNLASTPDKKQQRSDLHWKNEMQRGEAEKNAPLCVI